MSAIGFVGAGVMGAPMIANLVRAGHLVRAYGRSPASRERIEAVGGTLAGSVAAVAKGADVVITMVADSSDVQEVAFGADGLVDTCVEGQVFVDMSTIAPSVAVEVHAALAANGVPALDAPVSGGEQAAIDGTLSIMVGGDPAALEAVRPGLSAIGRTITYVGPPGSGQLTKAANQLIVAANLQAVAEAVVLLTRSGVELEAALSAIGGGLAGSAVLDRKRTAFLAGTFDPGFRVELHDKDLGIVAGIVREHGLSLPQTAIVTQLMTALRARGDGGLDHSALLRLTRALNGMENEL
ncbi:NAD(P)-dependent oxidoreductase [Kribbella sp. C-35]|uniref:NAD(P)-dependent oxidoreductase n=1 Tax=Kribbella sp. C-35 TaxID=2789276 RepID=UPI00397B998D